MFALILESLSSTELVFILVIALIFFGPRKLPQLARSMGKGLAEFRKASDDFKRTWEREVAMETAKLDFEDTSMLPNERPQAYLEENVTPIDEMIEAEPLVAAADPELVVARGNAPEPAAQPEPLSHAAEPLSPAVESGPPEPLRKQNWI
ncbi:MAG: twin-arginine translocase TatA/TatE family subunit [Pyrinomonadaceae bacterium]